MSHEEDTLRQYWRKSLTLKFLPFSRYLEVTAKRLSYSLNTTVEANPNSVYYALKDLNNVPANSTIRIRSASSNN